MKRAAILDLGTNTFHLLIIEEKMKNGFEELLKKRVYVKLALDGINSLSPAAMERGINAIIEFKGLIEEYNVKTVRAIGTAALRTAVNSPEYLERIKTITGIEVQLIDGEKEAELIYKGVAQVWGPPDEPTLIMDIGGGSVEFIIADKNQFHWSRSYPVGVAVLYRNFHHSEPISVEDQIALDLFLDKHLDELKAVIRKYQPSLLIGASGTFDVVGAIVGREDLSVRYHEVENQTVFQLINDIVIMNEMQRAQDPRIPASRIDMIVVALLLLKKVLAMGPFKKTGISTYALKEGVAASIFSLH